MTLQRKTPMRRTTMRRTPAPRRTAKVAGRRRDTGPTQATKDALWVRAGGRCEIKGCPLDGPDGFSRHHRRARGMGGTRRPDTNELPNLLLVCGSGTTGCHWLIESQRSMAIGWGWLVRQHEDPATEPAMVRGALRFLTADGSYADRPEVA